METAELFLFFRRIDEIFKRELKLLALLHLYIIVLVVVLVSQFSQNGTFWNNLIPSGNLSKLSSFSTCLSFSCF